MAEDLKVINRQLGEAQLNLPQTKGLGQMAQAYGILGQVTQNALDKGMSKEEANRGMEDALSGRAPSQTKNPFFKQSAAAYSQAYQTAQTNLLSTQASVDLQNARTRLTSAGNLDASSLAKYQEISRGIIEGTLQGADPSIQPQLAIKLQQQAMIQGGQVTREVNEFTIAQRLGEYQGISAKLAADASEALYSGDEVGLQNIIEEHAQNSEAFLQLGVDPAKIAEADADFTKRITIDGYTAEYYHAQQEGKAESFMAQIATQKPKGMGTEMWEEVKSSLVTTNNQHNSLVSAHENLAGKMASYQVKTGQVTKVSELDYLKKEAPGKYAEILGQFLNKQAEDTSLQQGVSNYTQALANKDYGAIAAADGKAKDKAYVDMLGVRTAAMREATGNPNYQTSLKDRVVLLHAMGDKIPLANKEIKQIANSNNPAALLELADAIEEVEGAPGNSVNSPAIDLDNDNRLFLSELQRHANVYGREATQDDEELVANLRKSFDATDPVKVERRKAYNNNWSTVKGIKNLKAKFEDYFGESADSNSEFFESFAAESKMMAGSGASPETIHDQAAANMRQAIGKSRFAESGKLMHAPPEDMDFANLGYWQQNQLIMKQHQLMTQNFQEAKEDSLKLKEYEGQYIGFKNDLNQLLKSQDSDPAEIEELEKNLQDLGARINRGNYYNSLGPNEIPETDVVMPQEFSQQHLVNNPIEFTIAGDKTGIKYTSTPTIGNQNPLLKYRIGGRERSIEIGSDARSSQTGNGDRLYYFKWKDDKGVEHDIPNLNLNGEDAWFKLKSFNNFVPDYQQKINNGDFEEVARATYRRDNPVTSMPVGAFGIMSPELIEKESARKKAEEAYVKVKSKELKEKARGKK